MHFDKVILVGCFPVLQIASRVLAMHLLDSLQRKRRLMLFFANTYFVVKCRGLFARMYDLDSSYRFFTIFSESAARQLSHKK
jgi:hypothetical protein